MIPFLKDVFMELVSSCLQSVFEVGISCKLLQSKITSVTIWWKNAKWQIVAWNNIFFFTEKNKIWFNLFHTPAERKLVFWSEPWLKPLVGAVGKGGSEKCIWKIFYRGLPEIGTPGTLWGPMGPKKFFWKKFSQKVIWVYVSRFWFLAQKWVFKAII